MYTILQQFFLYRKGFTLVETIVAVGIIVLMITIPVSGYIRSSQMIREEMNDLTAGYLQQEAIELMKMTIRAEGSPVDALFPFSSYDNVLLRDVQRGYYLARCSGTCDANEALTGIRVGSAMLSSLDRHLYRCGRWYTVVSGSGSTKQHYCKIGYGGALPFSFAVNSFANEYPISAQYFVANSGINTTGATYALRKCITAPYAYAENCAGAETIFKRNISLELQDTGVGAFCIKTFEPLTANVDYSDTGNHFLDTVRLTSSATWAGRKANLPELSTAMYRPFLTECN